MLDQKKLPQISCNKLKQLNKLIRHKETNSYKEINQTNQLTKDPRAQMVMCGVVCVCCEREVCGSNPTPDFYQNYFFFNFLLQTILTTTISFSKNNLDFQTLVKIMQV